MCVTSGVGGTVFCKHLDLIESLHKPTIPKNGNNIYTMKCAPLPFSLVTKFVNRMWPLTSYRTGTLRYNVDAGTVSDKSVPYSI